MSEAKDDLIARLTAWLTKRGQPDSGIDYRSSNSWQDAVVRLHGTDADFIANHCHGQGARNLSAAIASLTEQVEAARGGEVGAQSRYLTGSAGETIVALKVEVDTLRMERDALLQGVRDTDAIMAANVASLTAENEKMREALKLSIKIIGAVGKYIRAEDKLVRDKKREPMTSRDAADMASIRLLDFDARDCDEIIRRARASMSNTSEREV